VLKTELEKAYWNRFDERYMSEESEEEDGDIIYCHSLT